MATYLPNITDQPAPILPFQPDWNFLNQTLTMATQKWKIASEQASILYNTYLDAYHVNDDVRNMRDEYRKKIDSKLTELASHNLTDIRVMKAFKDLVTGLSSNPYYLYDLQISKKYKDILADKELWSKTVPDETSGYQRWHSSIEQGMNNMMEYYKGVKMTEDNLPIFGLINNSMVSPVDIDEEAYINALATQQFDKLKVSTQGKHLIGNTVSFAGPAFGGIQPYIVTETGGNAIRGFVHDVILKDFQDGNLKRLQDKKAIADMFVVGKGYNYDWSKVVEHYSTRLEDRIALLNNTAKQIEHQAKVTDQQAASFLTSVGITTNTARSVMERLNDAEKAKTSEVLSESAEAQMKAIQNIQAIAGNTIKAKEAVDKGKKDINSAMMAATLFHQIDGLNNMLISANKWVDAHTVRDIEYNKAFGDMLDYLIDKARLEEEKKAKTPIVTEDTVDNEITIQSAAGGGAAAGTDTTSAKNNTGVSTAAKESSKTFKARTFYVDSKNVGSFVNIIKQYGFDQSYDSDRVTQIQSAINTKSTQNLTKTPNPAFKFVPDGDIVYVYRADNKPSGLLGIYSSGYSFLGALSKENYDRMMNEEEVFKPFKKKQ